MHQIERLARLQALDRLQRRGKARQGARSGRARSCGGLLRLCAPAATKTRAGKKGAAGGAILACGATCGASRLRDSPRYCGGGGGIGGSHPGRGPWRRPIMRRWRIMRAPCACAAMLSRRAPSSCFWSGESVVERLQRGALGIDIGQALLQHVFFARHAVDRCRARWPAASRRRG